ncbi:hypothetical protein [Rheinheimera gaetbuli]
MIRWVGSLLFALALLMCAWLWWSNDDLAAADDLPADNIATQQGVAGKDNQGITAVAAVKELSSDTNTRANDALQPEPLSAETEIGAEPAQANDVEEAFRCDKLTEPTELAEFAFVQNWVDSHFYTQDLFNSHYDHLAQQQLLEQAQSGDVLAMRTLGRNYSWYASHQKYTRPGTAESTTLDREALGQARYWLQQAALAGYLGGFVEMSMTYSAEIRHLLRLEQNEAADIDAAIADIHILMHANIALGLEAVPLLKKLAPHLETSINDVKRTPEQQQQFEYSFSALYQRWQTQRTERGLPAQIELDVPEEVLQWAEYNNAHFNCIIKANREK